MIVNCGDRRIKSYKYGWTIQSRHVIGKTQPISGKKSKRAGEITWRDEQPAYPSTLGQALEMVYERILKETNKDIGISELAAACKKASDTVKAYSAEIRQLDP